MKKLIKLTTISLMVLMVSNCSEKVKNIDLTDKSEVENMEQVMSLEYRDFLKSADYMVKDMIKNGAVTKQGGGKSVLVVSRITNDTMQKIDTDMITKKIRSQLLKSGKVVVTTSMGLNEAEDPMVRKARELRQDAEVNQDTIAKKGTLVAPDLSLSGKITQRNLKLDDGERVEYLIQLSLTDMKAGTTIWEDERAIIKEGENAPTW